MLIVDFSGPVKDIVKLTSNWFEISTNADEYEHVFGVGDIVGVFVIAGVFVGVKVGV